MRLKSRKCAVESVTRVCRAFVSVALALLTLFAHESLHAQKRGSRVRILSGSALRTTPGGTVLGTLNRNFDAQVESEQGTSVRVRITGYVSLTELTVEGNQARATVSASDGGTLRLGSSEKEATLAKLRKGTVVFPSQKAAGFMSVGRPVWVDKSRLTKFTAPKQEPVPAPVAPTKNAQAAPKALAVQPPVPKPASPAASLPAQQANVSTMLRIAPDGDPLATVRAGAIVTPLSTEAGWTRVRMEGWIPTKDLGKANAHAADEVSAADLRAEPEAMKGRIVHWDVEAISYQLADGLRRELAGAPYILALGPDKERAILYLAVPDSLVPAARGLSPLSVISITARVRSGRSQPGGVPILDLLELSRR